MNFSVPIVGMGFRCPAPQVLAKLPFGTELLLQRQFDNPYDENAIKVLLPGFSAEGTHKDLYKEMLIDALPDDLPAGRNLWNISALTDPLFLGYVAAKSGEAGQLAPVMDKTSNPELPARLGATLEGRPAAVVELSPPKEALQAKPEINDDIPF